MMVEFNGFLLNFFFLFGGFHVDGFFRLSFDMILLHPYTIDTARFLLFCDVNVV